MKAVILSQPGTPDVLQYLDRPAPEASPGEVVIEVQACGLNFSDLLQRRGTYLLGSAVETVLGIECAGQITAVGEGVHAWAVGDRVCALLPAGGYAEQVAVRQELLLPCPEGVSMASAAALVEAACTVWSNLRDIGRLAEGERVLIHGGAGGIGSMAIQCATAWGAEVVCTAGGASKGALCQRLGARRVIDYRTETFAAVLAKAGEGVDVVLDNMGATYLASNIEVLRPDGRLVMIGLQGGRESTVHLGKMMAKRLSLHTTSLRDRSLQAKTRIIQGVLADIWPLVASGQVKPLLDRTFPLAEAAEAHRYMEQGLHSGKIVLLP